MANWKVVTRKIDDKEVRGLILPDVDEDEFDHPLSTAFESVVQEDSEGKVLEASVPKGRFVPFQPAGRRVANKRLYTVKAVAKDGTLIQLPLEGQINNNLASPETALGLQVYIRKGATVLFDVNNGAVAFCPTWDCWAEANSRLNYFCCEQHREITTPSDQERGFGPGATTSSTWGR